MAKEADVAVIALTTFAKEGGDRKHLSYESVPSDSSCQLTPEGQDNLVTEIASTGLPRVIVSAVSPAAALMPWKSEVSSIIFSCGFPGEQYGRSLADIIFGFVNPSGRLPLSVPNKENEIGFSRSEYPGVKLQAYYISHFSILFFHSTINS